MYILGLNDSNSAAAIIKDGQLVAAIREERLNRIKFSDDYPGASVEYCLAEAGIGLKDVDHVVFAWNPGHEIEPQAGAAPVRDHKHFLHYIPNNLLGHIKGDKKNKKIAGIHQSLDFDNGSLNIHFLPHHDCHAASAFFVSPHEKAAVMTIDAYGDDISHSFYIGEGSKLTKVKQTQFPHSIGAAYAAITQYLGYRANRDEWKVMGLAAYGEPEFLDELKKIISFDPLRGEVRVDLDYFSYYIWSPRRYSERFLERFGKERYPNDEIEDRHKNMAASWQKVIEGIGLQMANWIYEKSSCESLCLAGGVSMNSKMNGLILRDSPFHNVWVQPSADDGGGSLGSAFLYWNQYLGNDRSFVMEHDYWGPGYSDTQIEKVLRGSALNYEKLDNPPKEAARSIADGKVIGWFQGRMEFGQRALGNRSILADARVADMKDKINRLVKHREWYRPFAPAVLEESQSEFFELTDKSEFMQMVYDFKPGMEKKAPAAVHADGTGRIQTVTKKANPLFYKVIEEFKKLTGVGLILNTSFNDNNEPIVSSPEEAVRTFYGAGIEELYLGGFRLKKPGNI